MPDIICERCWQPVIEDSEGNLVHAEAADAAFCDLVMRAPDRLPKTCKNCPSPRLIMRCPDAGDCQFEGWIHVNDDSHVCDAGRRLAAEPAEVSGG